MIKARHILAILGGLAVAASALPGHAADVPPRLNLVGNDLTGQNSPPMPRKTLEWDSRKGRWGLRLGVEQRLDRPMDWKDLQPGLFYKVTPRLHIGGAVSLAPEQNDQPRLLEPRPPAPRVRLETTFKF